MMEKNNIKYKVKAKGSSGKGLIYAMLEAYLEEEDRKAVVKLINTNPKLFKPIVEGMIEKQIDKDLSLFFKARHNPNAPIDSNKNLFNVGFNYKF